MGLVLHNVAMAQLWDLGVRGTSLDVVAAWKEALLLVALARRRLEGAAPAGASGRPTSSPQPTPR